jgi:hypothetical protein
MMRLTNITIEQGLYIMETVIIWDFISFIQKRMQMFRLVFDR